MLYLNLLIGYIDLSCLFSWIAILVVVGAHVFDAANNTILCTIKHFKVFLITSQQGATETEMT